MALWHVTTFVSHIFTKDGLLTLLRDIHLSYGIENEDVVKDKGKTSKGNQIMKEDLI